MLYGIENLTVKFVEPEFEFSGNANIAGLCSDYLRDRIKELNATGEKPMTIIIDKEFAKHGKYSANIKELITNGFTRILKKATSDMDEAISFFQMGKSLTEDSEEFKKAPALKLPDLIIDHQKQQIIQIIQRNFAQQAKLDILGKEYDILVDDQMSANANSERSFAELAAKKGEVERTYQMYKAHSDKAMKEKQEKYTDCLEDKNFLADQWLKRILRRDLVIDASIFTTKPKYTLENNMKAVRSRTAYSPTKTEFTLSGISEGQRVTLVGFEVRQNGWFMSDITLVELAKIESGEKIQLSCHRLDRTKIYVLPCGAELENDVKYQLIVHFHFVGDHSKSRRKNEVPYWQLYDPIERTFEGIKVIPEVNPFSTTVEPAGAISAEVKPITTLISDILFDVQQKKLK